jgi:hypothetical protein
MSDDPLFVDPLPKNQWFVKRGHVRPVDTFLHSKQKMQLKKQAEIKKNYT